MILKFHLYKVPILLCFASACATATPRQSLNSYQLALKSSDAKNLRTLSDSNFQQVHELASLEKYLQDNANDMKSLAELLAEEPVAISIRSTIELKSGHVVHLILQNGKWKIRAGGIPVDRFDSPQASLSTFFRAYRDGRLAVLRDLIPKSHASRYLNDEQLENHLDLIRTRVESAENRLPTQLKVVQDGDNAQIPYGDGFMVRFVREGNIWKISDLE